MKENPLRSRRAEWLVTAPGFLWLALFFAVPALIVLAFTPPSSLPIPSLWVVPVHQPQASSIVHPRLLPGTLGNLPGCL